MARLADVNLWGTLKALALLVVLATALALAGCGSDDDGGDGGATEEAVAANGCSAAEQPAPKEVSLSKPKEKLSNDKTYTVEFVTNCGSFTVELDQKNNPKTAASFKHIVDEGVYDDTWFHRIVPDFVIQGGDPLGTGTGDAGYRVVEEPEGEYQNGTIAMAKGGQEAPGTSSSQFFVIIGAQGEALPPEYAIAGKVIEGMETVMTIAGLADPNGTEAPTAVALIESAKSTTE